MIFWHHIDISTGDLFAGLIVRNVRVNTHFCVVPRLRARVAVTGLACIWRLLPYFSCQNSTSGDVSRPVIDIRGGVLFLMDIHRVNFNNQALLHITLITNHSSYQMVVSFSAVACSSSGQTQAAKRTAQTAAAQNIN